MTHTLRRSIGIYVAAAAFAAALVALTATRADAQATRAHTHTTHGDATHTHATVGLTRKQLAFHDAMRKLWEDHVTWTRLAIVDIAAGAPSTNVTVARLLKNQEDIGNAVKPFYGKAAGAKLTALLKEHIAIAAEILSAAKSANQAGVASAQQRWLANANEIAALLHSANPKQWSLKMLKAMMVTHLDLTTREAVAWLSGDYAASVAAYENVHREILQMSDMLSNGIERQFPARFR